ncbi:MAG: toll/interleukin-1 receptor domain-containing protein [Cyanobacteria bacterium P01_G01_bin.4]
MPSFFVSYNKADKAWAEWIAWILEDEGHSIVIQAWDFRPGGNFVLDMQKATVETDKTLVVLSEDYLNAEFTQPEWATAFADDPRSLQRKIIPIKVRACNPSGLLRPIVYVDLVGLEREAAHQKILEALPERLKPDVEPPFPRTIQTEPEFPNPSQALPWNMPYERNAFFTGREAVLQALHQQLNQDKAVALSQIQAVSGLGGIGKTQTAVEYAYRHREDYQAVFWVRAETDLELRTGFVEIARLLNLPQKDAQAPNDTIKAVKQWLESNPGWLLIFDNADHPEQLNPFRPRQGQGHILVTSRAQTFDTLGIARPVSLQKMPSQEAESFLFTRTGREADGSVEPSAVTTLAAELGYLPLALEQAGAYILAQQISFQGYLKSYRKRRLSLLEKSGPITGDYPESVATTWSLNFSEVAATSEATADLLKVSAFLSPDAIPYEVFERGASQLGEELATALAEMSDDPIVFVEALAPLTRYSLVRTEPSMRAYSIARMVQEVVKAEMDVK